MGFLENVFGMLDNFQVEMQKNIERYRTYSTDRLMRELKQTSRPSELGAIKKVLEERGVIKSN